jgi:hypothetical protein
MKKLIAHVALALVVVLGSYQLVIAKPTQGKGPGEFKQAPMVMGTVSNINLTNKTFTLQCKNPQGTDVTFNVTYTEQTKFVNNRETAKPEDLISGNQIAVMGKTDTTAKTIDALMVQLGKMEPPKDPGQGKGPGECKLAPMVLGTVSNINLTNKTFTLQGKNPQGTDVTFNVTYTDQTKFVNNRETAKPEDLISGNQIAVMGKTDTTAKTIDALMVQLGKMEPPKDPGQGKGPKQGPMPGKGRGKG